MSNLICTIAIDRGGKDFFDVGVNSIKKYAKRIGVDFFIKYCTKGENCCFEKYFIGELLKVYDRVLYIDADIIIKDTAENLFDVYPDSEKFYIHEETERKEIDYEKYFQFIVENNDINWPRNKTGKYKLYNAGVFIVSRGEEEKLFRRRNINTNGLPYLMDQTTLNYNIHHFHISVGKLDIKHNAMYYFEEPGDFIHFANIPNRLHEMENYK